MMVEKKKGGRSPKRANDPPQALTQLGDQSQRFGRTELCIMIRKGRSDGQHAADGESVYSVAYGRSLPKLTG